VTPRSLRRTAQVAAATLIALACAGALPGRVQAADTSGDRFDVVVVDAGHGGEDEGAEGATGLAEKELVLDVAKRLAARLRAGGLRVVMTRQGDRFVPLEVRTSLANDARADLFVSIHANSSPSAAPDGVETYFVSLDATDEAARRVALRENEAFGEAGRPRIGDDPLSAIIGDMATNENERESSEFAHLAQAELAAAGRSRGVKQAPFVVLMGVQMPAALVEIGFLSNPAEERALRGDRHRDGLAAGLARAVAEFGRRYDARRGFADAGASGHTRERAARAKPGRSRP